MSDNGGELGGQQRGSGQEDSDRNHLSAYSKSSSGQHQEASTYRTSDPDNERDSVPFDNGSGIMGDDSASPDEGSSKA